jgi:hypothetical protein
MKKAIVVLAVLFLSSVSAQAQTGGMMHGHEGQAGHGMMGGEQMPMMEHMKTHGMMMQDMMQMMTDIMKMQKRIVAGVKPAEKKEMLNELTGMMGRMEKMMSEMKGMMSQGMMQGMMGGMASAETKKEEQAGGPQKTQEKSEAGVTAKVGLEGSNGALVFKVSLETHTVELDKYKFGEIVVLKAGGKEYKAKVKSEEGSGHHRSAVVEFDNPGTKEVEVIIKDVAGVKGRVFTFQR